jgi:hypothetical protein
MQSKCTHALQSESRRNKSMRPLDLRPKVRRLSIMSPSLGKCHDDYDNDFTQQSRSEKLVVSQMVKGFSVFKKPQVSISI